MYHPYIFICCMSVPDYVLKLSPCFRWYTLLLLLSYHSSTAFLKRRAYWFIFPPIIYCVGVSWTLHVHQYKAL